MINKFIYPTKKNMFIALIIAQLLPVLTLWQVNNLLDMRAWIEFEVIIICCLLLWQPKPETEMDEREKLLFYKSKSKILDHGSAMIFIPLLILTLNPAFDQWNLFYLSAVPVFMVFVYHSVKYKRDIGQYFYE